MKCYTVDGTGLDGLRLEERPDAGAPGPGEVRVDVASVSLNYRDLLVAKGLYGGTEDPPIIAVSDMAGVVVEIGVDVTEFEAGDRVLNSPFRFWPAGKLRSAWARTFVAGTGVDGVLAEQIVYPGPALVKLPDHMDFREGSTLPIAGLTAWSALVTNGQTKPGDWALLHGTGGVSIFAAQLARIFHVKTILTTSNPEKAHRVKAEFGVHETLDYNDNGWPEQAREITGGRGVDVVVDVAGGRTLPNSIRACASGGRVALIGLLAGVESTFSAVDVIMRQIRIQGIKMESTEKLHAFVQTCDAAQLRPCIDRVFPFDQARQAYDYLESQQHMGKVVIDVKRRT